jgi:glycosyltransferase involved in cell wall biosynthesis/predicted metal-dependent phosphoesterase TrpH
LRANLSGMTDIDVSRPKPRDTTKADLHCHSSASQLSRLGVQRSLGLPECATPPEEVYALAKRRGMDFVTITDHDTIDGVLEIAGHPDVFVSEELTAHFRGEPQAVHVLCLGIEVEDHEWLQAHSGDVELCAAYLHERETTCALAHPYYTVAAPLMTRHRRRLAELFDVWEVRNGARAPELNRPAATYVTTRDSVGIGGSDDHAGVDIGRTFTEAPAARDPQEFLAHVRAGAVTARGAQGSAAKWAHAAIALAARSLGLDRADPAGAAPDPTRVLDMISRVLREGDARHGPTTRELTPDDARALLRSWLAAVELDHLDTDGLIAMFQEESFSHAALYRRACRAHERRLRRAVETAVASVGDSGSAALAAGGVLQACIAAVPYAPAGAFLANEQTKLAAIPYPGSTAPGERRRAEGETPRVAILADGIGSMHGVTRTVAEIRQRGVQGFEIEVLGTDPEVDRRLSAVLDFELPLYPGLRIGVPSLTAATQTLTDGRFDAIHVCSPGPAGIAGALLARALGLPLLGSYHTELGAYAWARSGERELSDAVAGAVRMFYGACDVVLSPSPAADEALGLLGVDPARVMRWDRGVDLSRFQPGLRRRGTDGEIVVLYAGRITAEKGIDLLADAFLAARARDPRLRLLLAGGGPEQERLHGRLGAAARFLGWLEGAELATAYADADIFAFPSATDTFGQVIIEAQASGLPVVAVAEGGPASLIEDRVTGLLCAADPGALAEGLLELAGSAQLRSSLAAGARRAVAGRTWERALGRLADGYRRAMRDPARSDYDTGSLAA